ncbi:hypothetical protein I8748_16060 [Nostoc sp. CENA67]|uniref:SH3 domain-containing protein n=1 Tax=Amazonocrinis nigriterrae CENA67 TaxID=2794033 RepID=A0A8J7HUI2_9NOST|nr:hypothetical protein [Amazonocrinis nigriterrae]MBH8563687.1 hypothetical protein [Amazonocrinis nigriterrae CENA67]
MKRIIIGALLALPIAIASLPSQASAAEIIVRPNVVNRRVVQREVVNRRRVVRPVVNRRVVRQRLIPGHWERTRNGRRYWVPARYVRY